MVRQMRLVQCAFCNVPYSAHIERQHGLGGKIMVRVLVCQVCHSRRHACTKEASAAWEAARDSGLVYSEPAKGRLDSVEDMYNRRFGHFAHGEPTKVETKCRCGGSCSRASKCGGGCCGSVTKKH